MSLHTSCRPFFEFDALLTHSECSAAVLHIVDRCYIVAGNPAALNSTTNTQKRMRQLTLLDCLDPDQLFEARCINRPSRTPL